MIVAASTSCIQNAPLGDVFDRLADLEFTNTEIVIENNGTLTPQQIQSQFDAILQICKTSRRISPIGLYLGLDPTEPNYLEHFKNACQLAKAIKVVVLTIRASVHGTPFNEEVARLRELVGIAMTGGIVIGILTESGRLSETPETIGSLCKSVPGLEVTLDPSHFIYNLQKPRDYDTILTKVCHVRLRDTTSKQFQVRIGQGIIEFGKLVIQLHKSNYRGALCIDLATMPEVDPLSEMRKMRLLLESLL